MLCVGCGRKIVSIYKLVNELCENCVGDYAEDFVMKLCDKEICDGNKDHPFYAYCDLPINHAGAHNYRF